MSLQKEYFKNYSKNKQKIEEREYSEMDSIKFVKLR
jgi:hypothetical protein